MQPALPQMTLMGYPYGRCDSGIDVTFLSVRTIRSFHIALRPWNSPQHGIVRHTSVREAT